MELEQVATECGIPFLDSPEDARDYHQPTIRALRRKHYRDFHTIDWTHEYGRANLNSELTTATSKPWVIWLRQWSRWLILGITGVLVGVSTALLDYSYKWLSDLKRGYCSANVFMSFTECCVDTDSKCDSWKSWGEVIGLQGVGGSLYKFTLFLVTSLLLAFIAANIVKSTKFVRNSGIAEVKAVINGLVLDNLLTPKLLIVKWLGLLLIVSSGAWVGKEGPLVHISCACASSIMKLFPDWNDNPAKSREILVAASAAGIAVAFNTPIGGVIFTLEQLTSYFNPSDRMWTSFVCSMVGIVALNAFKDGIDAYVTMDNQWLSVEMIGFILLGVIGGFYGYVFNQLNVKFANLRQKFIIPRGTTFEVLEIIVLSIVTSIVAYPLVFPRLPLTSLIGVLYRDCSVDDNTGGIGDLCDAGVNQTYLLFLSGIVGFLLTAYTFGTIVPAGILMPSLVIGGIVGRLLGNFMEVVQLSSPYLTGLCLESKQLCISPGAYAVVGSAAFLTGVTKMTVWVVVTVFELTGALTYVLPIMITVLIARVVSDALTEYNCYDLWIKFLNYPYLHEVKSGIPLVKVDRFIKHLHFDELKVVYIEDSILKISDLERWVQWEYQGLPLLKSRTNPILVGWLPLDDLRDYMNTIGVTSSNFNSQQTVAFVRHQFLDESTLDLTGLLERNYLTLSPNLELPTLIEIFFKMKPRFVLFSEDGKFVGLLTLKDVTRIAQINKAKLREEAV